MKNRKITIWDAVCVVILMGGVANAASIPWFRAFVFPGETLYIQFRFDSPPISAEGNADLLLINGGSGSLGLGFTMVNLYADGDLIGIYTNTTGNAYSIFTEPSSLYSVHKNPTNLSSLFFAGAVGMLEYTPVFDPRITGALVDYQFSTFEAFRGIGTSLMGDYPAPTLLNVQVIPEPATLLLLGFGVPIVSGLRRKRS